MHLRPYLDKLHCAVCNDWILLTGYEDWAGNRVCPIHKDAFCASCGRYYGIGAVMREPQVWLCKSCMQHLITPDLAEKSIGFIRNFYRQQKLGELPHINLHVVSHEEMRNKAGEDVRGYTIYPSQAGTYTIVILRNLSMSVFTMVAAHELLHIWQWEKKLNPPAPLCEGFCNLGAFLVMQSIGKPASEGQLILLNNNNDPIYGGGFRHIKAIYDKEGWEGVIRTISQ